MLFDSCQIIRHRQGEFSTFYEKHALEGHGVNLQVLTHKDATSYFDLYRRAFPYAIHAGERAEEFALRIAVFSEMVWTIRLAAQPLTIIGDFALRNWDEEKGNIAFDGSLLPEFRGRGIMTTAFQLATTFARDNYQLKTISCQTVLSNERALRFVNKLGFEPFDVGADVIVLKKALNKLEV